MAQRPVYIVLQKFPFVETIQTQFTFYPGFSIVQARKSVRSLHNSFLNAHPQYQEAILEISTKSENGLGVLLSAFNLQYYFSDGRKYSIENVFQSGKCFQNGKQYTELLEMSASEAKKFPYLRSSGQIVHFRLEKTVFPKDPYTLFYDWLYVNALNQNTNLAKEVRKYRAFTDIAFNPQKSYNCQARSAALYVALCEANIIKDAIRSPENFQKIVFSNRPEKEVAHDHFQQLSMF